MTQDDAFLHAIIESPDDDTPRLVYADWLEENGQPERGEFIRVQCLLARMAGEDPRRPGLQGRERGLLEKHEAAWAWPVRRWVYAREFFRGFMEQVTARPEAFLEHADALFRAAPVRRVCFQTGMFRLARPPLVFPSAEPLMPRLVACPHLGRLVAVGFPRNGVGDGGVEALAASPNLGRVACLDLIDNVVGDRGVEALASSPGLPRLSSLTLASNRVGPAGARALALSRRLPCLSCLDLGENPVGDEGVRALAASPNSRNLTRLGLARSGLGTAGALALAESPHLSRLETLDVRDNVIGNKARQALRVRFGKGKCRF